MSPRALIGIRGALTASPLPHHRTFASRIRRFGSLSIITYTKTFSSGSPPPLQSPHLRTGMWSHRPEDTSLYYRSGLPSTHAEIPCLSLTPRAPSDRIAPLLVVCQSSFSERETPTHPTASLGPACPPLAPSGPTRVPLHALVMCCSSITCARKAASIAEAQRLPRFRRSHTRTHYDERLVQALLCRSQYRGTSPELLEAACMGATRRGKTSR